MKRYLAPLLTLMLLWLCSCATQPDTNSSQSGNIRGFAQKGQLVKGSPVTAFALQQNMVATGDSYPASISDDLGAFDVAFTAQTPYLELRAEGYFFNEITGELSPSPIYLEAIAPSRSLEININLLTTIIKPRIKRLIASGAGYDDAVAQAQEELFDCFGVEYDSLSNFVDADITGSSEMDALLLAAACIIQQGRSVGEVVSLIQATAVEFEREGLLSQATIEKLAAGRDDVDPFAVIRNLADYYADKGIEALSVPPFYKYLGERYAADFVLRSFDEVINPSFPGEAPHYEAIGVSFEVLSAGAFEVVCEDEFVSIEKRHILGDMYTVDIFIAENGGSEPRHTEVIFKDMSGRELARKAFSQDANLQVIVLQIGSGTRTSLTLADFDSVSFTKGDKVGVNGLGYDLELQSDFEAIVKVPRAESYFMSFPLGSVAKAGHIAKVAVNIPDTVDAASVIPYYAALAEYRGLEVANPAVAQLTPVVAMVGIRVRGYESISHLVIRGNGAEDYLCGRFEYVPDPENLHYFPDLDPTMTKGSGRAMTLKYKDSSDSFVALLPPVELASGFTIELYDADGEKIDTLLCNQALTLKAGSVVRLSITK